MKPLESFLLLTIFAANSISTADANSAEANSFKTKQHLLGSNFLRLFLGIKNILLIILIYFILFFSKVNAKSCLSFLPYGYNESYVHLPQSASFCLKQRKTINKYQTDNYGGRILNREFTYNKIQIFGDSQVLGLDIDKIEEHYLNTLYKKNNFVIYAAPNNGPYEVINFLNQNKKILQKKIVITFNFSTDVYRVSNFWEPKNYVALKDHELDEILEHPFKYRLIVFKNLSEVAEVSSGAPLDSQSGINSSSDFVSITAPESMCAPTSEPFSTKQTERSVFASMDSCFNLMAKLRPAGPPPTTTTSYSITSLSVIPY